MQITHLFKERFLPLLLVALLPLHAAAEQTTWYEVELIIFAQTEPRWDAEVWPQFYELPELGAAVELGESTPGLLGGQFDAQGPIPFSPLEETEYRLLAERDKLDLTTTHQVLLHTGWRQPGLEREQALAVRIQSQPAADAALMAAAMPGMDERVGMGASLDTGRVSADAMEAAAVDDDPAHMGGFDTPAAGSVERIYGTVKLILSRYLHLETALYYSPPESAAYFSEPPLAGREAEPVQEDEVSPPLPRLFRLEDSRRMRSRELHYIDHPLFGVIALVTPYEPPKPVKAQPRASNSAPNNAGVQTFPLTRGASNLIQRP